MSTNPRYRAGVDIGGTFTDIVLLGSNGSISTRKVLSTTDDYGRSIIAGLSELLDALSMPPALVDGVVHGTTVATNAILENKGARTALITTEGFRDVLELRRIRIPQLYNLFYEKPAPLVPRRLRFEVSERVGPRGEVRRPLDETSLHRAVSALQQSDVQAVAIALLHSYANADHERVVERAIRLACPELFVSCSADVLPEIREYERTSTTVINAYVGPIVERYLRSLLAQLRSLGLGRARHSADASPLLRIMQSNGGLITAESAMQRPANIVESGPAAGVIAAARLAELTGHLNMITLDMGGTTAKASIIENGQLVRTTEYEVGAGINLSSQLVRGGGYTLKLPFIDISEIGAGGGSIVWIDKGGMLQIGPQSAGATPGPVCYDQGGTEPTVTDALVSLGYVNPDYLAGGRVHLDAEKGRRVLEQNIARSIGMTLLETAHGVYVIASARMVRAVKAVSTYRGRDPRDFTLLAFGGNGAVFAAEMARELGMKRVMIPPAPGLFSAFGLLFADIEYQFVQTYLCRASDATPDALNSVYGRLEEQARAILSQDGYRPDQVSIRRFADLRYHGQAYELTIPAHDRFRGATAIPRLLELFGVEHQRVYGHRATEEPIDFVNLRITGLVVQGKQRKYDPAAAIRAGDLTRRSGPARRPAYFGPQVGLVETPVLSRGELAGGSLAGPLIVEEYDATCVVPPHCTASLDAWGNIVIDVE